MPKWLPKSMKMAPKIDLEPTLGSNFSFWEAFGAMQKYHDFLMPFLRPKKSEKVAQRPAKRRLGTHDSAPGKCFFGIWAPGRPRARPCTKVLETRNKVQRIKGYWKEGKLESSKRKQGYFKGSNTPKGLKAWRIF